MGNEVLADQNTHYNNLIGEIDFLKTVFSKIRPQTLESWKNCMKNIKD